MKCATETSPSGAGIDTLMFWSPGHAGWREADLWLREKYELAKKSVLSPNSLQGAMALQGMSLAILLRRDNRDFPISETHPKVLYHALSGEKYVATSELPKMREWLQSALGLSASCKNDHEFDAIISAYAAMMGYTRRWSKNLRDIESDNILEPVGAVDYWWPDAEVNRNVVGRKS